MKIKVVSLFSILVLLTAGAYAQDSTALSKKEMRQQKWDKRKAQAKEDIKETGQKLKDDAKVANDAVEKGTKNAGEKIGETVNKGLDKAETGLINERDKLRSKRDSSQAEKARRDSL